MKKNMIYVLIALVVISNLPPIGWLLKENYTYSNSDGSFFASEEGGKGGSYSTVMMNYGAFLAKHPEKYERDTRLFRTFTIKPWCFWEWGDMIFHCERFWLPYRK